MKVLDDVAPRPPEPATARSPEAKQDGGPREFLPPADGESPEDVLAKVDAAIAKMKLQVDAASRRESASGMQR